MNVGIPTEIKSDERRVSLTPAGAAALRMHGHRVTVQAGAGAGSGFADRDYRKAGAAIVAGAQAVWMRADMILKVKEPQPTEYPFMRPGQILFTYLHLAADRRLSRELLRRRVTALGYETIQLDDSSLPLLAPMSEVAGRLAIQAGSWCLQARSGGRGVLLSGASGVRPGKVVVLGGGISGLNACRVAAGVGAEVTIMDINPSRLRYLSDLLGGHVTTVMSNRATVQEEVINCDLVIGAVLVPGARAPRLLSAK
ncbi:MAG: alanine dehydrogenase, partial [Candidatus Binatus sp.]